MIIAFKYLHEMKEKINKRPFLFGKSNDLYFYLVEEENVELIERKKYVRENVEHGTQLHSFHLMKSKMKEIDVFRFYFFIRKLEICVVFYGLYLFFFSTLNEDTLLNLAVLFLSCGRIFLFGERKSIKLFWEFIVRKGC